MSQFLEQIWGIGALYIDENTLSSFSPQEAAIILATNPENYDRFIILYSFKDIFKRAGLGVNEYSTQLSQIGIINAIKALKIDILAVKLNLEELARHEIISFACYTALNDYLNALNIAPSSNSQVSAQPFHKNLHALNEIYQNLKNLGFINLEKRLESAYFSANNSKFKIAVTGVINAGKSSTLNALMNKNILGASNIPETASLSVITYSKSEVAKVAFWSRAEQEELGLESRELEDKVVPINELKNYTTAASPVSSFVKEVILGVELDILRDGIEIVDTPGLDDAVVLREQLTESYMSQSDFTMHLMNASQSATKKDISFITNTLKNGKSGGLIIALTHIDKLSKEQAQEVLEYTKKSIKAELRECGFDEELANDTKFFTISAISGAGINELKNYLYESFFGSSSKKAALIIENYKKELNHINSLAMQNLLGQKGLTSADKNSANEMLKALEGELLALNKSLEEIDKELAGLIKQLKYDNENSDAVLKSMADRIKDRVLSDIKYAKQKGLKPDTARLGVIVRSGFNDAFIDFFRDFKQRVNRDIDSIATILRLKLGTNSQNITMPDIKSYIDKNLPKIDYEHLNHSIIGEIKKSRNLESLARSLGEIFDGFLGSLEMPKKLQNLATACTAEFISGVKSQLEEIKDNIGQKEAKIRDFIATSQEKSAQNSQTLQDIEAKISLLKEIKNRIQSC